MSTKQRPGVSPSREPRRGQDDRAFAEAEPDGSLGTTRSKSTLTLKTALVQHGTGVKEGLLPVPGSRAARPPAIVQLEQQEALAKSLLPHDTSERPALVLAPRRYPLFVSVKDGAYRVPVLPGHTGLSRLFPLAYDVGDDLTKGPKEKLAKLYDQHPSFKGCFSFELFIKSAEPESTMCDGGNVIDLYRLPQHCSFDGPEYIDYAEFTVELSVVAPHLRTPVRLALFNTNEAPVWDESDIVESQRRLADSNEVNDFLRAETHRSIQEMMEISSKLCVLYDTTSSPSAPAAYALRVKAVCVRMQENNLILPNVQR